jgi:CelD/BcsL family acetyltransferase involved in cellulose biosynthesis
MLAIRPVWERLACAGRSTVFQDFDLNLLAARVFAKREAPYLICARTSYGEAVVPAVLRDVDGSHRIGLLGEELFDYRSLLYSGEHEVLRSALARLAELRCPLDVVALRQTEARDLPAELCLSHFTTAPGIRSRSLPGDTFAQMHLRLARNLRRLQRLGYELRSYNGEQPQLLRTIYQNKAAQDANSLFQDPVRVEFMVNAGLLQPHRFEIFTLESAGRLGAAVVTLLEQSVRRFYTCWFTPEIGKHSPALSLIYEITRRSLAAGLDCDYMTGEQPYKRRLATSATQLFKLHATSEQLAALGQPRARELNLAG